jgi:hypothetical protein
MSNVPVLEAVRAAFAFRKTAWRPVAPVLSAVAVGSALETAGALSGDAGLQSVGTLIYLVSTCMAYAALMRLAFTDERPDDPELKIGKGGFQWTRPEVRLLGVAGLLLLFGLIALSLFIFLGVLVVMVLMGGGVIQPIQANATPDQIREAFGPQGLALVSALAMAFAAVMIFVSIRVGLAPAATIARGRVAVFQTWRLTKGQFWRIFAATLLSSWPMIAAQFIATPLVSLLSGQASPATPTDLPLVQAAPIAVALAMVLAFVQLPVSVGLTAFLYRGLRPAGER